MVDVWTAGITALMCLSSALADPVILNPSFEDVGKDGRPLHWTAWNNVGADVTKVCTVVERADAPDGKRVGQLAPTSPQITIFSQNIEKLLPGQWYEVSGVIRCEKAVGHGCHLGVEYWQGSAACGGLASEPITGTQGWRPVVIRFQAPGKDYRVQLDFAQSGNSGTMWADNLRIRRIRRPSLDPGPRRILEGSYWGMFTCYPRYLHKFGKGMKDAGVYWQRMGLGSTDPAVQKAAKELGMAFAACIDGMPGARDANDPCYPVSHSADYLSFIRPYIEKPATGIRIWEIFNEPNLWRGWTLDGYSNVMNLAGKAIKATKTNVLVGTGGFGLPYTGYVEAVLARDKEKVIDVVLIHPYAVDEGLDSQLWAVTEACRRTGRPDIPVAINETGWPTWDPATGYKDYSQFVSEETQARNIVKMHVQGLAHKLSFVTYLAWNDITEQSDQAHNMGLVRVDGSRKPAFHAYRFLTRTIGSRRIKDWFCQGTGTRIYRLGGEKPIWVIWNALRDVHITVDTGSTAVFPCDIYGAKMTITPVQGKIDLSVSDQPLYLVPAEL